MRRQLIVILAAGLPALVGCGSATTAGSRSGSTDGTVQTTEPDPRSASTDVAALMQFEGGHTTRQTQFTRVPIFAVYGDGRVITVGAQIAIFPGPALPSMQIAQLTSVEVAQIAGSATAAT